MQIITRNFGEIEINKDNILTFPDGLPGFEDLTEFIIIQNPENDQPFHWLQAVEDGDLAFVIINPFVFKPDYDFTLSQNTINKLDIQSPEDINVYNIVVIPEEIEKMTANLKAPIIINTKNKKAKQIVLEKEDYHTKHYIMEELKKLATPQATSTEEQYLPETVEGAK